MNRLYVILFLFLIIAGPCRAQISAGGTFYSLESSVTASTADQTPFWIASNRYGTVPLESGNGYLRASVYDLRLFPLVGTFAVMSKLDVIYSTPRERNMYVQQAFVELLSEYLHISIGSKEDRTSLWDTELGSGDMVASANARPVPEINISVPQFTPLPFTKGLLQVRCNFAAGRSFDADYLKSAYTDDQYYVRNIFWHHKALHLRIADTGFPLSAVLGIRHRAQWGGTSNNPEVGVQPHSFKDFLRIVAGRSGGESAALGDQINVLGSHFGSYDIKLGYLDSKLDLHIYKQHFFNDASGMELFNLTDGLYGIQANLHNLTWLNKIVVEYINTMQQSGPVHYVYYDHALYPGFGGGWDNYYNNGDYTTGMSYFGRSLGSPLLTSPEYNEKGRVGFRNNRVKAFHAGLSGRLSSQLAYRLLATSIDNRGTMDLPYLKNKHSMVCALKMSYCHPRLESWQFDAEIAADAGTMYKNNVGLNLTVTKNGFLKGW